LRRTLADGIVLDDDRARVDAEAVHAFLRDESYWAGKRSLDDVRTTIENAARVVGLYDGQSQIGFARVVSDDVHFAYLADVYVLGDYRGRGFGVELVREAVDNGPHADLMWTLKTMDAQGLYTKFGFGTPDGRWLERHKPQF
jgi:ribosomal protein S18 acetylase RimI-like enzyme